MTFRFRCLAVLCGLIAVLPRVAAARPDLAPFVERHCVECHDAETKKGGLDLTLLALEPASPKNFATWVTVYDRVSSGEMPPKKKARPEAADLRAFTNSLATTLLTADRARIAKEGRATQRRLNRFEYEETLRDLLALPYLEVKSFLPEDPEAYGFNKIGEALDVSHVQMARYLTAAEHALRQAMAPQANRPETVTNKLYTWGEPQFSGKIKLEGPLNRRTFPLVGLELQRDLMAQQRPRTSPASDAERRETESMAVVVSTYEPTEIRFGGFRAPVSGKYRLKFTGRSIWMGPTFTNVTAGRQSEPVTIYADTPPRLLRKLGSFDFNPEPTTRELEVWLLAGETIRPDAARLFRSRPPDHKNPLATPEGMPGVAFASMQTIGPIVDQWPPASHQVLFGNLPLTNRAEVVVASANTDSNRPRQRFRPPPGVEVVPAKPEQDAEKLLRAFMRRAYRGPVKEAEVERFAGVVRGALKAGHSFTEAMIAGYTGVLSSPAFLYFNERPGKLDDRALAERLSYFLWNSAPDEELRQFATRGQLRRPETLRQQTERLLNDSRSRRFVDAFLAYWLDLRTIAGAAPDEELYPDYQLDDLLSESIIAETELFFAELLKRNLPARNVVSSDFAMLNERLGRHYGIPDVAGVNLRPVSLPADSLRGGLLTSASVLKVTANGTSTSPVKRGAWIMTRILGKPPAPPPPSVTAVEPDIRGATTIREQLAKHRDAESCAACHRHIDPAGFALENFDVMGGWRERYRSVGGTEKVKGIGHNGNYYHFSLGLPVDATGELPDGRKFSDVRELKQLLVKDEEQLARNLTRQLAIYATGAPIGFADRIAVEKILARSKASGYGTRQLVHELVQSDLFLNK